MYSRYLITHTDRQTHIRSSVERTERQTHRQICRHTDKQIMSHSWQWVKGH